MKHKDRKKKLRAEIEGRKKKTIGKITLEVAAITALVSTSIILFSVLKCYSLFKCLSK